MMVQEPSLSGVYFSRLGSIAAISGVVICQVFAMLHPHAPPYETEAAFADYAAEPYWVIIHLGEMLGILLIGAAALTLTWRLRRGRAGAWATLGAAGAVAGVTVYGVYMAVDGVALKIMVDRWAAAGPDTQGLLFETAFAVRQIEAGLVGVIWLMFGVAGLLYGGAFFLQCQNPAWSGVAERSRVAECRGRYRRSFHGPRPSAHRVFRDVDDGRRDWNPAVRAVGRCCRYIPLPQSRTRRRMGDVGQDLVWAKGYPFARPAKRP